MASTTATSVEALDTRKVLGKNFVHTFAATLGEMALNGESAELRIGALFAIKEAAKNYYGATSQYFQIFFPAIEKALKGIDTTVSVFLLTNKYIVVCKTLPFMLKTY